MFDLTWDKPKPLVPRRHRLEVAERIAADGSVVEPLDEASVVAAAQQLVGGRHRGRRRLPHQQLPQPRPRAAHRGDPARALPAPAGLRLLGRAARAQGVRAHQHDGRQRLPALGHAHLSPEPGKRARLHRHQGADPRHHLQRRHARGLQRRRKAGVRGGIGPCRRRDRRNAPGRCPQGKRSHRLRHGRHHRQGRDRRGRPSQHDLRVRVPRRHLDLEPLRQGRRLHAEGPRHRHRRGRRRRRLAGRHRPGWPAARRPRVGRRRARPRLLRPRQRAPDRHRRQRRARLHQPERAGRRPPRHRPQAQRACDRDACRQAARPLARGRRARHPRGGERRHVARHPRRHGRARPRPARPHARRHRRQRRHPRARRGARPRHRPRRGAAARRRVQRGGHAGLRPRADRAHDRDAPPRPADYSRAGEDRRRARRRRRAPPRRRRLPGRARAARLGGGLAPRGPGERAHRAARCARPLADGFALRRRVLQDLRLSRRERHRARQAAPHRPRPARGAPRLRAHEDRGPAGSKGRPLAAHLLRPRRRRHRRRGGGALRRLRHAPPRSPGHRGVRRHHRRPARRTVSQDPMGNIVGIWGQTSAPGIKASSRSRV